MPNKINIMAGHMPQARLSGCTFWCDLDTVLTTEAQARALLAVWRKDGSIAETRIVKRVITDEVVP